VSTSGESRLRPRLAEGDYASHLPRMCALHGSHCRASRCARNASATVQVASALGYSVASSALVVPPAPQLGAAAAPEARVTEARAAGVPEEDASEDDVSEARGRELLRRAQAAVPQSSLPSVAELLMDPHGEDAAAAPWPEGRPRTPQDWTAAQQAHATRARGRLRHAARSRRQLALDVRDVDARCWGAGAAPYGRSRLSQADLTLLLSEQADSRDSM
jgi:hypothetical protein